MTLGLAATLVAIAVLDSLNPSLFFAQFYLLTTPRPIPRLITYILGILTVNFLGGLLILSGASVLLGGLAASIPPDAGMYIRLALGAALIAFGLLYRANPLPEEEKAPRSLHPLATFVFGAFVMLNEITTALPYFIAIDRINEAQMPVLVNVAALVLYNIVFALPLFGFLALFVAYREAFTPLIARISAWLRVWMPRIMKYTALAFGLFLVLDVIF